MIHTRHIMLGRNAEHMLSNIYKYILKYEPKDEKERILDFFGAMLYVENEDGDAEFLVAKQETVDGKIFLSGIEETLHVRFNSHKENYIPAKDREQYLSAFFTEQHRTAVNIELPTESNSLHICIYVPLYDAKWIKCVESFLKATESLNGRIKIDIVMISPDLAYLFNKEENNALKVKEYCETATKSLSRLIELKKVHTCISHLINIQNSNSEGKSLNMNEELFGRIFGEYALLATYNYNNLFIGLRITPDDPHQIHSIGLSVLSFDKYYFIEYLLQRAYRTILERESVGQEKVNVNKVSIIVQKLLENKVNIFSNLYDRIVKPQLDLGIDKNEIISEFGKKWKLELEELTNHLLSFIDDEKWTEGLEGTAKEEKRLSLPEKRCVLAQLLGEDDELLDGNIYNRNQLVLDDCEVGMVDLFTSYNNKLLQEETEPIAESSTEDNAEKAVPYVDPDPLEEYAALSPDKETPAISAASYLKEIKELKNTIKDKTNYIRNKEEQLESLQKQSIEIQESHKVLTEEGFIFQGKTYKLQNNVNEIPLAEDYEPKQNNIKEVDLRHQFTPIRDQGAMGACASFATISIYEHIHKKNKNEDIDLSEYFLYYNARAKKNDTETDSGSSIYHNIESMTQEGVCKEELCKYRTDSCSIKPTEEAYTEAETRKFKKALNVKGELDDLRSALAEGYPIIISLKIFESFNPKAGFIPLPSGDEKMLDKHGNHAMVICGYSDEKQIFIVRNSWGTAFGDKGYCYIPYSYISDPNLLNFSCIVTEISEAELVVIGGGGKTSVIFDEKNTEIRIAILKNLIGEAKVALAKLEDILSCKILQYDTLFESLGDNSKRLTIQDGSEKRLQRSINRLQEKKRLLETERDEALSKIDNEKVRANIKFGVSVAIHAVCLIALIIASIIATWALIVILIAFGLECLVILGTLLLYIYKRHKRKRRRRELDTDYKERIKQLATEIDNLDNEKKEIPLRMHIAGEMIDSFWRLTKNFRKKLSSMHSYIVNLNAWLNEMQGQEEMVPLKRRPFMTIISNETLDEYFAENMYEITNDLWLYKFINDEQEINEEAITEYKRNLKEKLCCTLKKDVEDFSIYKHITGIKYKYVNQVHNIPRVFLPTLDNLSNVFTRFSSTAIVGDYSSKVIFCKTSNQNEQNLWRETTNQHFISPPTLYNYLSNDRVVMVHFEVLGIDDIML